MTFAARAGKPSALSLAETRPWVRLVGASAAVHQDVYSMLEIDPGDLERHRLPRASCTTAGRGVDVATGKVFSGRADFSLGTPLPIALERVWISTSTRRAALGHGWHHNYDLALAASPTCSALRLAEGRVSLFAPLGVGGVDHDPIGRQTLSRDRYGYVLRHADGFEHRFIQHRFQAAYVLGSLRDRSGHALRFGYDDCARLVRITDGAGRVLELGHDREDRIIEITGPHPLKRRARVALARYAYDGLGNLVEVRDALGHAQHFAYAGKLLVRETDRNGLSFYFEYDSPDQTARCVRSWGDGGLRDHALDYEGPITIVRDSLGQTTTYVHDGAAVRTVFDAFGHTRSVVRGAGHRIEVELDELRRQSTFAYDARGNLIESSAAGATQYRIEYDARDRPVRVLDALGGEWSFTHDARGRLTQCVDPCGRVTRNQYRGPWLVGRTDGLGHSTAYRYDAGGSLELVATAAGAVTRCTHDGWGRTIGMIDPNGNVQERELDLLGRLVRIREGDGTLRELEHDAEGNVVRSKSAHGEVRCTYAEPGRLRSRWQDGSVLQFHHDSEGRLAAIERDRATMRRFERGPTGRVIAEHGQSGKLRSYERDCAGRVMRVEELGGSRVYTYDSAGRVIRVQHSDGAIERYGYRPDGALTMACNESAVVMLDRDALGRVVRERQDAIVIDSEYDALGMRVRMRSSLGTRLVIERERAAAIRRVAELTSGFEAGFERDVLGRALECRLPGGARSRWQRDSLGRSVEHALLLQNQPARLLQPSPDPHDPARGADSAECAYDALARLLEKRELDGRVWHYEWNVAGRLARVVRPDGEPVTFGYDALGRRVWKKYLGQTTRWVWDGDRPLHEWIEPSADPCSIEGADVDPMEPAARGTRALPITWLFEPETALPLAKLRAADAYSIVSDDDGTARLLIDSDGQPLWAADSVSAEPGSCPFRRGGQYEDAETGLLCDGQRYYDPKLHRHLSPRISGPQIGVAGQSQRSTALPAHLLRSLRLERPNELP